MVVKFNPHRNKKDGIDKKDSAQREHRIYTPFVAICDAGLEKLCADELTSIGACYVRPVRRAVLFSSATSPNIRYPETLTLSHKELLYKVNLWSRLTQRILRPLSTFTAFDGDQLYQHALSIPWENFFSSDSTFAIEGAVHSRYYGNTMYPVLRWKDGVADRFRQHHGKRPSVRRTDPDIIMHLFIENERCTISLDSSGQSLFKRGYREVTGDAPIKESLAAALIALTDWDKKSTFVDPMCGSGTIAIEAAMIAFHRAPGLYRDNFAFQNWKDYDQRLWKKLTKDAEDSFHNKYFKFIEEESRKPLIIASDHSKEAMNAARKNAKNAGVEKAISFHEISFENLQSIKGAGTIVINPPYGERLANLEIGDVYEAIGDTLKKKWEGFEAWILSGNKEAFKRIGLKASKKIALRNGSIECSYQKYSLYEGSKKNHSHSK